VTAKAPAHTKPRTDADTVTIQCLPRTVACPASPSGAFLDVDWAPGAPPEGPAAHL
jgi:hypothetical protein